MTFSVTTVTDCGMSRSSCLPLPMRVSVACTLSLPCGSSTTVARMVGSTLASAAGAAGAAAEAADAGAAGAAGADCALA